MLILALILYDTIIQCTYHYEQAWTWYLLQSVTDIVILSILTCEIIIKLIVYGIRRYFKTVSCSTEFVLTTISYLGLLSYIPHLRFFILFRCFRILRLFRVLKFSSKIKLIMKSVWLSIGIFFNITVVLCILFFIYAVVGVFLFYDLPTEIANNVCSISSSLSLFPSLPPFPFSLFHPSLPLSLPLSLPPFPFSLFHPSL